MGWWGGAVLPRVIDRALGTPDVGARRAAALSGVRGQVLEIGFGSGLNLAHYPAAVESVVAVEPSDVAWRLAAPRVAAAAFPVRRTGLDGERLPVEDATVDAVVSTFTLCTIPDVARALAEARRVLRPGGALSFLEHGRAPDESVRAWQRRLDPWQGRLVGGCRLSRPVDELVRAAGFDLVELATGYGEGLRPFSYLYRGRAVPDGPPPAGPAAPG